MNKAETKMNKWEYSNCSKRNLKLQTGPLRPTTGKNCSLIWLAVKSKIQISVKKGNVNMYVSIFLNSREFNT